ncbi:MAG: hypothetical protein JOZ70_01760 [Pseudolabrys sp.]|nr:hypothetical protein [Pseudolabrys sp.]
MSDAPAKQPNPAIFYVICVMLVGSFLYRVLVTANEYPSRTAQVLEMAVDAALIAGLVGLRRIGPMPLFVIALIAGIGLFAIRLHSDASWWTGHWNYNIYAR